jgi:predicted transcriptional regulator of viral defense system
MITLLHMRRTNHDRLLKMAQDRSTLTAAEVTRAGIHSQHLTRLIADRTLERISRGRYRLAGRAITEHHGLAMAAAAAPRGVICLLSALSFHEIGTQLPAEVWFAIQRGTRPPTLAHPPLRVVHFSGAAFSEGVEIHNIEGETVRIYSVAKTLADLFKYRNRIGLDVAMEALREAWVEHRFTMESLDRAACVCRVGRVMRPYVEGIVA